MTYVTIVFIIAVVIIFFNTWQPGNVSRFYTEKPLWFAHRGALVWEPENTLVSYQKAVKMGLPALELDVLTTKDGIVLCSHNFDLERETNGFGYIHHLDYADLNNVNAAVKWKGRKEFIPTLEEILDNINNDIRLNIEIKTSGKFDIKTALKVAKIVKQKKMINRTVISSFNPITLWVVKKINKKILTGFILETNSMFPFIYFAKPDFIHPKGDMVTNDLILFAKKKGLGINAWTVNTKPAIDRLINLGVDGIITDRLEFYNAR